MKKVIAIIDLDGSIRFNNKAFFNILCRREGGRINAERCLDAILNGYHPNIKTFEIEPWDGYRLKPF